MTTSIVDIFNTYKNESDTTADSVATEYANLDIEWVVKDGNQTISANTSWGNATPDTRNLLVLVKGNLTVDAGYTLTAAARKRGMFIYVNGDLNLNGIISMTARGASAAGQRLLLLEDGETAYEIPAAGGAGGAQEGPNWAAGGFNGNNGTSGVATGACGGGASGGIATNKGETYTGAGGAGTSYSGGAASGGAANHGTIASSSVGAADGGTGSAGAVGGSGTSAGGGAGNPGGAAGGTGGVGTSGTGGLLVLFITGTITFGAAGALESTGSTGGACGTAANFRAGGGGSGGGRIDYFYNAVSGTPTITVTGGAGAAASGATYNGTGGTGGDGSSRATEVSLPDLFAGNTTNFFMFF